MLSRMIFHLCMCATLAGSALGASPAGALGQRYTDALHGFSIRPPAEAQVRRESGATELVQFLLPEAKTGRLSIRMSLLHGATRGEIVTDLAQYGRALAAELRVSQNFQTGAEPPAVVPVAGKQALVLEGIAGGSEYGIYRRDVWVLTEPNRFLVVRTSGPPAEAERIKAVSQASVASLSLFDGKAARAKLEADLKKGSALLDSLDKTAISHALAKRDYWLALLAGDRPIGFMHVTERLAAAENTQGWEVITESATVGADGAATLLLNRAYCSFDRTVATWTTLAIDLQHRKETARRHKFGLKQNELLISQTVIGPHQVKSRTTELPHGVYAPMALRPLLDRLTAGVGGPCAFAEYNTATEDIDMRTIAVVGAQPVVLSGKKFPATLINDTPALGAPAIRTYLGADGLPLKIVRNDGTVLQQTTAAAIRSRFAEQLRLLADAAKQAKPQ